MKKLLIASAIVFLSFAPHVFAQGFTALAPIPGLTDSSATSVINSTTLANFFNNLYKYLVGLAAILAVIEIIWGGLEISTKDSVSKQSDGKERITQAIFGLILVLSPVLVFSIINPSILNLSLNLPPLIPGATQGTSGGSGNGGAGNQPSSSTDANGCDVSGTSVFTKASCPTQAAAQSFVASCSGTGTLSACQTELPDGSCGDTSYHATCGSTAGPYLFVDVSSALIPSLVTPLTISSYQPQASSPTDADNGSHVVQFSAACSQGGGTTCIKPTVFSVNCTFTTPQPKSQNNKCYSDNITCIENPSIPKLNCSSNPNWSPIK